MISTAQEIYGIVTRSDVSAVTLRYGYAQGPLGGHINFEVAHVVEEKRNLGGRCTKLVAKYKDGSRLEFKWSKDNGAQYKILD